MKPETLAQLRALFAKCLEAKGVDSPGLRSTVNADAGELYIYGEIGDFGISAKAVSDELGKMKAVKVLNVYVNSIGGSIWDAKAIHSMLTRFAAKKTVYVDGIAASAASFISMAGDRIITAPSGTWMIHRAMGGAFGFSDDLRATADVLDKETENIIGIYAARTRASRDDLASWMADESVMNATEAKDRGFTDEIAGEEAPPKRRVAAIVAPAPLMEYQRTQTRIANMKRDAIVERAASRISQMGQAPK